ncbi:class I SAM-dependent methyltransferase [Modestobacter versicolor]|uniref:Class I SAM-dependent methyltransferase n=1 Tax=Modestobacter versicolor TaxID=429133 RepID=A0A323V5M8_9ACTN|nr:class I SAM-dependent methyltransferase [Modestobacter versicolor]MBB3674970.1 trans-aconitate methyltransferase [Modestobacter versicolor]PZA19924.1 class I SAM-dependent methyltransferase [Modestobacter versicolor]
MTTPSETTPGTAADWSRLLADWDAQQSGYLRAREERFTAALDAVEVLRADVLDDPFTVLDLACGPGSFSQRVLARFPAAQVVAVDVDPVLLAVGRHALGTAEGRLQWVDADLRDPAWPARLPVTGADVVVSSTALHWLSASQLAATYRRVGALVPAVGLFLNADNMAHDPGQAVLTRLAEAAERRQASAAFERDGVPDWDTWWAEVLAVPELAEAAEERRRRTAGRGVDDHEPGARLTGLRTHVAALVEAGFTEVGTIWQDHDDRVLLAVR